MRIQLSQRPGGGLTRAVRARMLLLVEDKVLRGGLDARLLEPEHALERGLAGQVRVRAEPFPVAPAGGEPPEVHHGRERDVRAFSPEFAAERVRARADKFAVPTVGVSGN